MTDESQIAQVESWLERLNRGDAAARDELVSCASERLRRLTQRMLNDYPRVHRWEETDDVWNQALERLYVALAEVNPPTARDFYRLANLQIRRILIDLSRKYGGPMGLGANHQSGGGRLDESGQPVFDPCDVSNNPVELESWTTFHEHVDLLPDDQREVFHLIYYQDLNQSEIAELLGVSERTVKRRWQEARLALCEALDDAMPLI